MLQIYNTLSRQKEVFQSIEPGKVKIYVCGMTVYDYCHLGHARVMVAFDVVARFLRHLGYQVTYVRNVTDIDDKIIRRAQENQESIDALTSRFIDAMHEDERALGVLPPDIEPHATQSIDDIITMISTLIKKGFAYIGSNGDVFYTVSAFKGYGKLSGKQLEDLRAGERVDVDSAKRDPLDFVLWKSAKPGEPSWTSPFGPGRPGWHIECSAMSTRCLGDHFDIHGGGMDLQFPHHENEIAQSEAATGHPFVNYWMHNGFVRVNEEKMSKSLGNFFTVREILTRYRPEVLRFFILNSHYRSPLNYCDENLDEALSSLTRLYTALRGLHSRGDKVVEATEVSQKFIAALNDDFNTAEAIAVLFESVRDINRLRTTDLESANRLAQETRQLGSIIGLLEQDPDAFLKSGTVQQQGLTAEAVDALIQQRQEAKHSRNWSEADRIREVLKEAHVILEDGPQGTTWRRQ